MKNLNRIAYIILAVLVGVMLIAATIASFAGDNSIFAGDGSLASAWFPITLLGIYALVQIGCLTLYHFGFNVYKIGFALLHVGILVMLVGFLAGAIGGKTYSQNFVVGRLYSTLAGDDAERTPYDPGYDVGVANFTVERYEPDENGVAADKYYRADLRFRERDQGGFEDAYLEMNKTYRKDGLKYYLMAYDEGKVNGMGYNLLGGTLLDSYEGSDYYDLYGQIAADYPDQTLTWRYFNWEQGAYNTSSGSGDRWQQYYEAYHQNYPGYAYVTSDNGTLYVHVYPKLVVLFIKQDPGEYAVLAGMVLVMLGTVMTCLLRRKKRDNPALEGSPERKVSGS